ncbi:MAG: hypothetical protein ABIF88_01560 [archaeon]
MLEEGGKSFSKKGAAHFEMVVAFLFFIGFVFFLFVIIEPYDSTVLADSVVSGVSSSFQEKVSVNLIEFFVEADSGSIECFSINLPNRLFGPGLSEGAVVKSLGGDDFSSGVRVIEGEDADSVLTINSTGKKYYYVSVSPEFVGELHTTCSFLDKTMYQIGNVFEREVVSYKKLTEMNNEYSSNYELLKYEMGVPDIFDFAITSEDLPIINMENNIPESLEVMTRESLMEVLYENGTTTNVRLVVKVW